jgi:hypothetical protein
LLSDKNEEKMCKNLKLIALAIDENFSALFTLKYKFRTNKRQGVVWLSFNIVNLSPLGWGIFIIFLC